MPARTGVTPFTLLSMAALFALPACGSGPKPDPHIDVAAANAPPRAESQRPDAAEPPASAAPEVPRGDLLPDEMLLEAFRQSVAGLELETARTPEPEGEPEDLEANQPPFASLAALFEDEGHALGCRGDTCPGLRVLADLVLPPLRPPLSELPRHHPITRALVVGTARSEACSWMLLLQTEGGWLRPKQLGDSPRGCKTPIHRARPGGGGESGEPDLEETAFFPLDVQVQGSALRLVAQSVADWSELELVAGEHIPVMDERAWRVEVRLCVNGALGPGTFACSREAVPARPQSDTQGPKGATRTSANPLTGVVAHLLPLSEAARVGAELAASWDLAPPIVPARVGAPSLDEALSGGAVVSRLPLGPPGPSGSAPSSVLASPWGLYLARAGQLRRLSSHYSGLENERFTLTHSQAGLDHVRVDLSRTLEGEVEVTWRWAEIVTPSRHIALATGVELRAKGELTARWERRLEVDADGVTLSPGAGQLAWFRGVGRFAWDELERATARWRLAFARAWEPHWQKPPPAGEPKPGPAEQDTKDIYLSKMRSAPLMTLPGYAEPLDWAVVDAVHRL